MIFGKKVLAVIPARSGSKRLPGKNARMLKGKPLIAYSIEAGLQSSYVDEVLVSTDDEALADISRLHHAWVPFIRPKNLATDEATTSSVLEHALQYCKFIGKEFGYILLLQPTSPLRSVKDIDAACEFLINKRAKAVISVCQSEHNPLWSNTLPQNLLMTKFLCKEVKEKRSQDLPTFYRLNGAIYLCAIDDYLTEKTFFLPDRVYAYVMDQSSSIDIDTVFDFQFCEYLLGKSIDEGIGTGC